MTIHRRTLGAQCGAFLLAVALAGGNGCSLFLTSPGEEAAAERVAGARASFEPRAVVEARIDANEEEEGEQRLLAPLSTAELAEHRHGDQREAATATTRAPPDAPGTAAGGAPDGEGDDAAQKTALARNPARPEPVAEAERTFGDTAIDAAMEGLVLVLLAAALAFLLHAVRRHTAGFAAVVSSLAAVTALVALLTALAR